MNMKQMYCINDIMLNARATIDDFVVEGASEWQ